MGKTKYLFDENTQTPEGMVSVSQLQTYMSCPKKWAYNYIEKLSPRVEKAYLSVGKLCHKGMQVVMQQRWEQKESFNKTTALTDALAAINTEWKIYMDTVPLLDEEVPDVEQTLLDAISVFTQAFEEFDVEKYEVLSVMDKTGEKPALELHFVVPCAGSKGLHGYIDVILRDKETGFVWCTDYKFRKSLSPDSEESFNIQNAVYSWACNKMGINITGTMTWQHVNTPASEPQVLKNGTLSRAKIKTTWAIFEQKCNELGIDPSSYQEEMVEKLADIEWYRATYEYRNTETIKNMWDEVIIPASRAVARAYKSKHPRNLYPWNCKMCQYQSICQGELRNYDVEAIRLREYTKR